MKGQWGGREKKVGVMSMIQVKQEYHGEESSWPPQMLLRRKHRRPSASHGDHDDIKHLPLVLKGRSLCTRPLIH